MACLRNNELIQFAIMPQIDSAKKALRQSLKRRDVNRRFKKTLKEAQKKYITKPTEEGLKLAFSLLDKAVKKNIIPKNRAARNKSRLSKLIGGEKKKTAVKSKGTKAKKM